MPLPKNRSPKPVPVGDMFINDCFNSPRDGKDVLERLQNNFDYFLVNYLLFYFIAMTLFLSLNNPWHATLCNLLLVGLPVLLHYNTEYKYIEINGQRFTPTCTFLTRVWLLLFIGLALSTAGLYFLSASLFILILMVVHSAFVDHRRLLLVTNKPYDWVSKLDARVERFEAMIAGDDSLETIEKLEKAYYRAMKLLFMALFLIEDTQEVYNNGVIRNIKASFKKMLD